MYYLYFKFSNFSLQLCRALLSCKNKWITEEHVLWMRPVMKPWGCFYAKLIMGSVIVKHFCVVPNKENTCFHLLVKGVFLDESDR